MTVSVLEVSKNSITARLIVSTDEWVYAV